MHFKPLSLLTIIFALASFLSGCGGSSTPPSVSVTASASSVDGSNSITLTATVTNDKNSGGVTWSATGGTLSGQTASSATYTAPAATSSAQSITITATSVADGTKTGTATITVPAKPAITTGALAAGSVGTAYSATIAGSGGIGPYVWSITSGTLPTGLSMSSAGVISGTPMSAGVGSTNLTFLLTDAGKATALTATVTLGLTINPAPAIAFTGAVPATATYNAAYTGSAAASGGAGALTYSLTSGAIPTGLNLNTATGAIAGSPTAPGTFAFTVKAADSFGDLATQGYSITVNPATPTLTFATIATHIYGDAPFAVSATSASTGAVSYSVTSGPATIVGNTVSITGVGTVVLGASQAATTNFTTATASTTFTVNPETPTLTFAGIATHTFGDAPFAVSASSASSGAVSYSVTSGPATIAGNTVTLTGAGTVVLGASQVANGNYGTATASSSFTVSPATATLSFTAIATHTFGDAPFTVSATSASSGAVTYSVTSGPATVAGNTVTLTGAGTVVLGASQAATTDYTTASATTSFTVNIGVPTLAFAAIPNHAFGDAPFTVSATSASNGSVTYSVTSGPATIAGNTVTLTGLGTVVLGASQAATANYATATATTSFAVGLGVPSLVFASIPTHTFGDAPFTVSATSASSGAVTYSVTSGPATIAGNVVTLTGAGAVVLGASQASTTDFTSATASISFTVSPATPALTFTAIPSHIYGDPPFTVSATSASSGAVTYSVTSGPATIAGNTVTLTGAGTVVLGASQAATSNYTVANASTSFTVDSALSITTSTTLPSGTVNNSYSQSLVATGGSGGYSWSVSSGDPNTLPTYNLSLASNGQITGNPSVTGTASFTAVVTDSASHTARQAFSIAISNMTINTGTLTYGVVGTSYSQTLTASGGSGGYSWTVTSGASNLAALGLTLTSAGVLTSNGTSLTTTGSAAFTVQAKDSNNVTATASYTIYVYAALTLTTTSLNSANYNANYSAAINAAGGSGNYTWSVNNASIPASGTATALANGGGLTGANDGSGTLALAGIPNAYGTITLAVQVTDTVTGFHASKTYSVSVISLTASVNPDYVPQGMVNMPYTFGEVAITGGTGPYSITYTNAPAGLAGDSNNLLVGSPTASGTATVTVKVTDSSTPTKQVGTTTFSLPVVDQTVGTSNSKLNGQYACYLDLYWNGGVTGGNGTSTLYRGGAVFAFTANGNGALTGGEIDQNSPYSGYHYLPSITGAYAIGSDNRGYINIGTGQLIVSVAGGNFSGNVFQELALTAMDDAGTSPSGQSGGGHCYKQVTTALNGIQPSGSYVFGMHGETPQGNTEVAAGQTVFSGSTATVTQDMVSGAQTPNRFTGSFTTTATDSYGRMMLSNSGTNFSVQYQTNDAKGDSFSMTMSGHNGLNSFDFMIGQSRAQSLTNIAASSPINGPTVMYLSGSVNVSGSSPTYKSMAAQVTGSSSAKQATINSIINNNAGAFSLDKDNTYGQTVSYTTDASTGRTILSGSTGDYIYLYDTNAAVVLLGDKGNGGGGTLNLIGWMEPQTTSGSWTTSDVAASAMIYRQPSGNYESDLTDGVLTTASDGTISNFAQDEGGAYWASWDEGLSGTPWATLTGALALNSSDGSNYGLYDMNITSGGTTTTQVECYAISVDAAVKSTTRGKMVCIDINSSGATMSIVQE